MTQGVSGLHFGPLVGGVLTLLAAEYTVSTVWALWCLGPILGPDLERVAGG